MDQDQELKETYGQIKELMEKNPVGKELKEICTELRVKDIIGMMISVIPEDTKEMTLYDAIEKLANGEDLLYIDE